MVNVQLGGGMIRAAQFLVVGRAGMDLYADPPGDPIEGAGRFVAALGGSAANIAVALVRQGAGAALVSAVSADAVGGFVRAELARYGVSDRFVTEAGGECRTSLAVVETRAAARAVIYRNEAADFQIAPPDFGAEFGAVVLTGTALALEPSRAVCFGVIGRARALGLPVVLDVDFRRYSWASDAEAAEVCGQACALADIVVGNDEEFAMLAQSKDGGGDGLALARSLGARAVVVYKMGGAGSVTISPQGEFASGVFPVAALKPTGAGDGFMGGFLSGLASGAPLRDAVARGAATAAIIVTRVGCAPASPDAGEVTEFMRKNKMTGEPDAHSAV